MTKFKIGSTVQLKSGGQEMTVVAKSKNAVVCQWFVKNGELKKAQFPATCLKGTDLKSGIVVTRRMLEEIQEERRRFLEQSNQKRANGDTR